MSKTLYATQSFFTIINDLIYRKSYFLFQNIWLGSIAFTGKIRNEIHSPETINYSKNFCGELFLCWFRIDNRAKGFHGPCHARYGSFSRWISELVNEISHFIKFNNNASSLEGQEESSVTKFCRFCLPSPIIKGVYIKIHFILFVIISLPFCFQLFHLNCGKDWR